MLHFHLSPFIMREYTPHDYNTTAAASWFIQWERDISQHCSFALFLLSSLDVVYIVYKPRLHCTLHFPLLLWTYVDSDCLEWNKIQTLTMAGIQFVIDTNHNVITLLLQMMDVIWLVDSTYSSIRLNEDRAYNNKIHKIGYSKNI